MNEREIVFKSWLISKFAAFLFSLTDIPGPVTGYGQAECNNNIGKILSPLIRDLFYGQDAQYVGPTQYFAKRGQSSAGLTDTKAEGSSFSIIKPAVSNHTNTVWIVSDCA